MIMIAIKKRSEMTLRRQGTSLLATPQASFENCDRRDLGHYRHLNVDIDCYPEIRDHPQRRPGFLVITRAIIPRRPPR